MSFGFSIGDFITLSQLALNIYNSCKSSPAEFKSITSEVNTLSVILESIASHLSDHSLDEQAAKELELLHIQTREVLEDIKGLLQKHGSLGQKRPRILDRFRWALNQSSDVRTKLLFHAGVLSCLNTSLTKLSQDRLEQNLTMLIKNFTESATAHAENPLNSRPLAYRPALDQLQAWRASEPPDSLVSVEECSLPDVLPRESEIPISQCGNGDFLPDNWSSEVQHWAPPVSGESIKSTGDRGQASPAGSNYQHVRAGGNSFQINGNIGESTLWSCRNNTYFDVVAGWNSIQLNGNVLDPTFFLSAAKC